MKTPLVGPILAILKAPKDQLPKFRQLADGANLHLFRQHFLIMNALYQLQSSHWQEENLTLSTTH